MKKFEVHYFTNNEGDGTHLFDVLFPETPQLGCTVEISQIRLCRSFSSGLGTVVKIVMREGIDRIMLGVKELKI